MLDVEDDEGLHRIGLGSADVLATVGNVTGDMTATAVVAARSGASDEAR